MVVAGAVAAVAAVAAAAAAAAVVAVDDVDVLRFDVLVNDEVIKLRHGTKKKL